MFTEIDCSYLYICCNNHFKEEFCTWNIYVTLILELKQNFYFVIYDKNI